MKAPRLQIVNILFSAALGCVYADRASAQPDRRPVRNADRGSIPRRRRARNPTGVRHALELPEQKRAYRLHIPKNCPTTESVPLVLCFHGGGGNAEIGSRMGMTPVADRHDFIVAYPEGVDRHWNDGRKVRKYAEQDARIDDVAFVLALLAELKKNHRIDPRRIFAMGASNGGFFTHRLAIECADTFSAAGILIATMPRTFATQFTPAEPVSIIIINGTEDPFVPYDGGEVTPAFFPLLSALRSRPYDHGFCSSTDKAINLWLKRNSLRKESCSTERLEDKDPDDGCTVLRKIWQEGEAGTCVALYTVEGGGHTIPGGAQYLPKRIIGKTCRDFNACETLWAFFEAHRRK